MQTDRGLQVSADSTVSEEGTGIKDQQMNHVRKDEETCSMEGYKSGTNKQAQISMGKCILLFRTENIQSFICNDKELCQHLLGCRC